MSTTILLTVIRPKKGKLLKLILIIGMLLGLALLLSACAYPGQDPPCVGSNKNAPGCADPVQKIVDDQNGGPWYVSWALDIVRSVLSSVSINAVRLGISVFWQVFTNLSSTDFASCGTGTGADGTGATCQAASVFAMVNTVAVLFLPLILVYKIFKGYFLGGLIESFHEGFLSFFPKIIIGGFAMYFLAVLFSGAFGISNILFDTIIGGAASLADISRNMLGNCPDASVCSSGIGSVGDVKNIGLLLFVTIICLLAAIVFIVLGLVFFLRTIIVFILFAISPLAIVAGLTEEFRPWFGRWLSSVQAMLIAPIPVAICFALVKAFTGAIPSANGDPAGFILQLVYIISFLAIGAILMFKIAGSVGGMAFGLAAAGAGFLTQGLVGGMFGKGSQTTESEAHSSGDKGQAPKGGKAGQSGNSLSSPQSDSAFEGSAAPTLAAPTYSGAGSNFGAPALGGGSVDQQQRQLLNTLRSLNENLSSTTVQRSVTTTTNSDDKRFYLSRTAGFNMQNAFLFAGTEVGLNAPYFQFPPLANHSQAVSNTHSIIEQKANRNYTVPAPDPLEEGATGRVPTGQSAAPPPPPPGQTQTVQNYPAPQVQQPAPAVPKAAPTQPQPLNQPAQTPNPAQPQPAAKRLKITGVIPNPYGQPASGTGEPFVIGRAKEDTM